MGITKIQKFKVKIFEITMLYATWTQQELNVMFKLSISLDGQNIITAQGPHHIVQPLIYRMVPRVH